MGHNPDTVPGVTLREQRTALLAAANATDEAARSLVDGAILSPEAALRAGALSALRHQDRLAVSHLVHALNDPSPLVRRRAAQLASTQGPDASGDLSAALIHALDDEDVSVVVSVLVALGDRQDVAALGAICDTCRSHSDALVVEEAVATLGALGDPRGLDLVLAATEGKPALRRRSVAALGAFEGDHVEAALDRLANDRDWQVRQAVAMLRREDNSAIG